MDWKDVLGQLKEDPSLPPGETSTEPEIEHEKNSFHADRLHIVVEKKGRGGKTATIIEGFTCSDEELSEIAARLKKKLGVGGSARGGEILIQGNLPDQVKSLLKSEGYKL